MKTKTFAIFTIVTVLFAMSLVACGGGDRREWTADDSRSACPAGGTAFSYYFREDSRHKGYKIYENPEAAATKARADGCEVANTIPNCVVACCR